MPQSNYAHESEVQDRAEHAHERAAVSHDEQDHLNGTELQRERQEKSRNAHERAERLVQEAEKGASGA